MTYRSIIFVVMTLCFIPGALRAEPQPDALKILEAADKATKAVISISYDSESHGEGGFANLSPTVTATVKAKKSRRGMFDSFLGRVEDLIFMNVTVRMPGVDESVEFKIAVDGRKCYRWSDNMKQPMVFPADNFPRLVGQGFNAYMQEYTHPTPFSDEINALKATLEEEQTIGGVRCDVVHVFYAANHLEARWAFGQDDHLPRRVERFGERQRVKGRMVTTLKNVVLDPELPRTVFQCEKPRSVRVKDVSVVDDKTPLLPVGQTAPTFELKTADGKPVKLKELRGNIVVLEFWAAWCPPCRQSMPGLQKIHQEFKDKPVKVIGVYCSDRGDPVEVMRKNVFNYGLLMDGDQVAETYKVTEIPTLYIIDEKGKIIYAAVGFLPDQDKKVADLIRTRLSKITHE